MALEYRLTLASELPLEVVAPLVVPEATESPAVPGYPRLFSAAPPEQVGYVVSITAGTNGYYDAEIDENTQWVWEPSVYVDVDFRMSKDRPVEQVRMNVMRTVGRVLAERPEDAALVLNGNWLLLTRVDGRTVKHNLDAWYEPEYDALLPK